MYEDLYTRNRGLLFHIARRYANVCKYDRAVDLEDLAQVGFFGLVKAAATFDITAGKTWISWAAWYIRREMETVLGIREGKFTRTHTGAISLDSPLSADDPQGDTLGDMIADDSLPDTAEALALNELRQGVRAAVNRIQDEGQRQVIRMCRLDGMTAAQAAEVLHTTVDAIRRDSDKAMRTLRKDRNLRALAEDLDEQTRFHAHKSVTAFNRDWTSVTEGAALWRVEQTKRRENHT